MAPPARPTGPGEGLNAITDEVELEIRKQRVQYRVRLSHGDGAVAETTARLDFGDPKTLFRLIQMAILESDPDVEPIRTVGEQLFRAVFKRSVLEAYNSSRAIARDRRGRLRIVLRLADPELESLPWEALWDPDPKRGGRWVARHDSLVRRVEREPFSPPHLPATPPLHILGVVGGREDLDIETEQRRLGEALAGRDVDLEWVDDWSWASLQERINDGAPIDVLHFSGHGRGASLQLIGANGKPLWVDARQLADLIQNEGSPIPLVVLNACMSGRGRFGDPFSGTASTLVRSGVSAVVAMQFAVDDDSAIAFSQRFYGGLASGREVDAAVMQGRLALMETGLSWLTPVVYVGSKAVPRFELPARSVLPETQTGDGSDEPRVTTGRRRPTLVDPVLVHASGSGQPGPGQSVESPASVSGREPRDSIGHLAEQLANLVRQRPPLESRMVSRREGQHLAVRWGPAGSDVRVESSELVTLAEQNVVDLRLRGTDVMQRPAPRKEAERAWELGDGGRDLANVLKRVPTGWLVILGEGGSGKSTLMWQLMAPLLNPAERKPGGAVPVFLSLSSWDPEEEDLLAWLEQAIPLHYGSFGSVISSDWTNKSNVAKLLDAQKVLPFLDGLDDLPVEARHKALVQLNQMFMAAMQGHGRPRPPRLVITCRTQEYREAVRDYGHGKTLLYGAAVIELRPLDLDGDAEQVASYLSDKHRDRRWAPVAEALRNSTAVRAVLRSPLYVGLADAVYNHSQNEQVDDPADLCNTELFPDENSIRRHLLERFVVNAYSSAPDRAEGALNWLNFLARRLQREGKPISLEWWSLDSLAPRGLVPVTVGAICGIAAAIAAVFGSHVGVGIGVGLGIGIVIAVAIGRFAQRFWPVELRTPKEGIAGAMAGAAIGALAAGLAGKLGLGNDRTLFGALPVGLGVGIGCGASTGPAGGFIGGLMGGLVAGLLEGVGVGLPAAVINGFGVGVAAGLAALCYRRRVPASHRFRWTKAGGGIVAGLMVGIAVAVVASFVAGIPVGLAAGVIIGGVCSLPFGLRRSEEISKTASSPAEALAQDSRAFRRTSLLAAGAAFCVGFVGDGLASAAQVGDAGNLWSVAKDGFGVAISSAIIIGLCFGLYHAASPSFVIANWWLALRRELPARLMRFLDDAFARKILGQDGAAYQFRHEAVQAHLAGTDSMEVKC